MKRRLLVLPLLALLALAQVQQAGAHVGIIWREFVLSWDHPGTQLVEDLASQTVPTTDPTGDARGRALHAARACQPIVLAAVPPSRARLAIGARITRAPPVA
jgi:hypothetical protein